jgi:hypothetical protein
LRKLATPGVVRKMWEKRFSAFNKGVRAKLALEVGAIVVDANQENFLSDRRFLAFDRLTPQCRKATIAAQKQ